MVFAQAASKLSSMNPRLLRRPGQLYKVNDTSPVNYGYGMHAPPYSHGALAVINLFVCAVLQVLTRRMLGCVLLCCSRGSLALYGSHYFLSNLALSVWVSMRNLHVSCFVCVFSVNH